MDGQMEDYMYQPPGRGPRLYHKKSRSGCATCKRRRVKCDEKRPSCTGCSRHGVACVYPTLGPGTVTRESTSPGPSSSNHTPTAGQSQGPESQFASPLHHPQAHQGGPSPLSGSSSTISVTTHSHMPESQTTAAPTEAPTPETETLFYYPPFRPPNSSSSTTTSTFSSDPLPSSIPDPTESPSRRLWELRLLHNYVEILRATPRPPSLTSDQFRWEREIPLLALQSPAILYAVLAQSALNLYVTAPASSSSSPSEKEDYLTLQQTYLALSLREQCASVSTLSRATADLVCMASLTILHHSYALVQTTLSDDLGNWQPPLEWLRVGRGTGKVMTVAQGLMTSPSNTQGQSDGPEANKIHAFLASRPVFDMDDMFADGNREPYLWLLDSPDPEDDGEEDNEMQGQVTRWVYQNALSYMGWTEQAIRAGDPEFAVHRRLAAFAVWMPDLYEEFCRQGRPRALVVLAWFFRLWIPYGHKWEVNGVGERMVRGIYGVLDGRWRGKLEPIMREYGL